MGTTKDEPVFSLLPRKAKFLRIAATSKKPGSPSCLWVQCSQLFGKLGKISTYNRTGKSLKWPQEQKGERPFCPCQAKAEPQLAYLQSSYTPARQTWEEPIRSSSKTGFKGLALLFSVSQLPPGTQRL